MIQIYSKCLKISMKRFSAGVIFSFLFVIAHSQQGTIIPTNTTQKDFLNAYKFVLDNSDKHYRNTGAGMDKNLFQDYGEYAVYWSTSGTNAGSFIFPDALPASAGTITSSAYTSYNWAASNHLALHFNRTAKKIAIFRSSLIVDESTISWEAAYFKNLFDTYLFPDVYYFVDEAYLNTKGLSDSTELLIIPAFNAKGSKYSYYADSIVARCAGLGAKLESFLSRGGTIYTEGNAASLLEKSGVVASGSFDYASAYVPDKTGIIQVTPASHPIASASQASGAKLFSSAIPTVKSGLGETIATLTSDSRAVAISIKGSQAKGGKILCNFALPTVEGISKAGQNSRQLQWTLNSIMYAFSHSIDVTRSVSNVLAGSIAAGRNSVSFDRRDTFDVKLVVRNLSDNAISNVVVKEDAGKYFKFLDVKTAGVNSSVSGNIVSFNINSIDAHSETVIVYRLVTPNSDDPIHENVDKLLDLGTFMKASVARVIFTENGSYNAYTRNKDYANIMFSARIFGDTDINWKNFLGLDYQPFKVFLMMENKERTPAEEVVYTQYVPKDIPFYWSDKSINIPILRTPGGKFVNVLKGSNDEKNPEYDMDSDGKPDAWLDTTSIYPKGYKIVEEEVYWANPWNHLRTGSNDFVFEDIDHDGKVAKDTNGDGIVDVEEPGDKIRVWKITWNVGRMEGHQYYDPYCSLEVWVDPPDLVPLAAGVGKAQGKVPGDVTGMFIPYKTQLTEANLADSSWSHWMERDENGKVIYKQLIFQRINNYQGYTFIDTLKENYKLTPFDKCAGTVPQPHEEFIAVLSMGGEEIDMYHPTPTQSLYSKINYKTIYNEERVTPIRTTYTYYAPLPNPLQFEYLSDNFTIYDTLGTKIDYLPKKGKAKLVYDLYPSTEYTYYWIRNVGHDVDYNDPSEKTEGVESLGDGVFGYMIYDIPRGMGGYTITLPRNADGSYNTDSIVRVEGKPFTKWLDNPNTGNKVEIWEDPFQYHVYIPQLLIPPALDDDNNDGIDDWKDDRGDRFQSSTGYLHDAYMPGNGEDYPNSPATPFKDDIYGMVTSGWDAGADKTYGDDFFETLGKTHIQICANYEGKGREGNLDISKGGTVVVEEIFGGSPWVIFSHVMSGFAKGVDLTVKSSATPSVVKFGTDTVFIKHEITDLDEPHTFDANFDPYHISRGYGEASLTAIAGGKDPCSLIIPDISTSAIVDPAKDSKSITIFPNQPANKASLSGTFIQLKVEVTNATDFNWSNTTVEPVLTGLANSSVVMKYVAYPRPLVPDDNIGTFAAGWRFNQPENEVLVKIGNSLPEIQPTRRAYFIFLLKVDPSLKKGVYEVPFTLKADKVHYSGAAKGSVNYDVPAINFCITEKDDHGQVKEYQKFSIDKGNLKSLAVNLTSNFNGFSQARWSVKDATPADFAGMKMLPVTKQGQAEVIDLTKIPTLLNADTSKIYILQKGAVTLTQAGDSIPITTSTDLKFSAPVQGDMLVKAGPVNVSPVGPIIKITNKLYSINGVPVVDTVSFKNDKDIIVGTLVKVTNLGSDVSQNTIITIYPGSFYKVIPDSLPSNCTVKDNNIVISFGSLIPGESKQEILYYKIVDNDQGTDLIKVIRMSDVEYKGTSLEGTFKYTDPKEVNLFVYEFRSKNVGYIAESGTEVNVTAEARNLGIPAANVWFRIYPVIDGGIREFPIAEMKLDSFKMNTVISLSGIYTIPAGNHKVEFVAVIDDGEKIFEILENNNIKTTVYAGPTGIGENLVSKSNASAYPNPVGEQLTLEYTLPEEMEKVNISIVTIKGSTLFSQSECSNVTGKNLQSLNVNSLPSGTYYYRINATGKNKSVNFTGKIVKK